VSRLGPDQYLSAKYNLVEANSVTIQGGNAAILATERERSDASPVRGPYWYGTVITALFVVLVGAGLIFGRFPLTGKVVQPLNIEAMYATGSFKRHLPDGEMCRFTIYDNKEGIALEDRIARCDEARIQTTKRRQSQFNWGK
jgi:hypothetical protein